MIIYLTTADTDILTLKAALPTLPSDFPAIRAANVTDWLDRDDLAGSFLDQWLDQAKLVILLVHGGRKAQPYAFDRIRNLCHQQQIPFMAWPGNTEQDPELDRATNVPLELSRKALSYTVYGGVRNFISMLHFVSDNWLKTNYGYDKLASMPWAGIYQSKSLLPISSDQWAQEHQSKLAQGLPVIGILFYRAHWMSQNIEFIDSLCEDIAEKGGIPLPIFAQSLKENSNDEQQESYGQFLVNSHGRKLVDGLIVTMSFAVHGRGNDVCPPSRNSVSTIEALNVPVLQAIVSFNSHQKWDASDAGLSPLDIAMNVALPEFDGRIITVPISFKEVEQEDPVLKTSIRKYAADRSRTGYIARLAIKWSSLGKKANWDKRVAFLLNNSPSKNSRIGNAVGMDSLNSIVATMRAMAEAGYDLGDPEHLPRTGDELAHLIIATCSNDRDYLTEEQLATAHGRLPVSHYAGNWEQISEKARHKVQEAWGRPPGDIFVYEDHVIIPGVRFGHIFVGLQPPRGFSDNPSAIYHSPDLVPTHHYISYYRWLRDTFGADAVVHLGKHGTLEWLPGKGIGLSENCYPEVVLDDLPNFYPYIINNPGEGTQAKRRTHATIIDHMVPVITTADTYGELSRIELLLEEYYQVQLLDPKKLPYIQEELWKTIKQAQLDQDLHQAELPTEYAELSLFLKNLDGYLCELKEAQIRDGLHILGETPKSEAAWVDLLYSLVQHPNGDISGLPSAVAESLNLKWTAMQSELGETWQGEVPRYLASFAGFQKKFAPRVRDMKEAIEQISRLIIQQIIRTSELAQVLKINAEGLSVEAQIPDEVRVHPVIQSVTSYVVDSLIPRLLRIPEEIGNLLVGLNGGFVPAGPSGAPTRGMADILPTGRNFYSVDPQALPSTSSWRIGLQLADELIQRYVDEENEYPKTVAIIVWGTSAMRTRGDDIAQIYALMGVRPVWQPSNGRVMGLEVISLEELGRPRVDVTVRISGFFRDAFPHIVRMIDDAVKLVSELDEPDEMNPLRKHIREEATEKLQLGMEASAAHESSQYRIFGSKPGTYGAGLLSLIESGNWETEHEIAEVFMNWSSYAYTSTQYGTPAPTEFKHRLSHVQIATKNQDNREHDIFDSDDYFQEHGGMIATIRSLTGNNPKMYFGDTSNPSMPKVRDITEEAMRVFRSRVVNPKWLESARRHGYKGAVEMANTTDFLFGYDATAHVIEDWMYEKLSEEYILNQQNREFLQQSNPWALKEIAERLLEAAQRKMWESPNPQTIEGLMDSLLQVEEFLEERGNTDGES
ncbi:cobaltochelatase subunit CobN [Paenibacillus sp. Soil766]|nr:cobaltochelatase subunit CobN [Paenibacillus sp. Soil766]